MSNGKEFTNGGLILGIMVTLLLANLGLFYRMNQLQSQVIEVLAPFQIPKGLEEGITAPSFILRDLTDKSISLDTLLEGNLTQNDLLLVFSSTSCSACQEFWPVLNQFHKNYPNQKIVMISRGSIEDSSMMANKQGFDFQILQSDEKTEQSYKIPGTPYLYLVSKEKVINFAGFSNDLSQIESTISDVLN
ncbi:MAG: redoxin domain-containing protein [Anaerolineaceae bacterium]|nr:redoxin domain-containing protein [Anaerolineaceae bacterium]